MTNFDFAGLTDTELFEAERINDEKRGRGWLTHDEWIALTDKGRAIEAEISQRAS